MLGQQSGEINLRFDHVSTEREDLIAAQYLKAKLRIRATADCATHRKYSRKAALTLGEVTEPRSTMDKLHRMTLKLQYQLDFGSGENEPKPPDAAGIDEAECAQQITIGNRPMPHSPSGGAQCAAQRD